MFILIRHPLSKLNSDLNLLAIFDIVIPPADRSCPCGPCSNSQGRAASFARVNRYPHALDLIDRSFNPPRHTAWGLDARADAARRRPSQVSRSWPLPAAEPVDHRLFLELWHFAPCPFANNYQRERSRSPRRGRSRSPNTRRSYSPRDRSRSQPRRRSRSPMTGQGAPAGGTGPGYNGAPHRSYEDRSGHRDQAMNNIRETSQQDRRVYVGNLSYDVKWHHLKDFMRQGGF